MVAIVVRCSPVRSSGFFSTAQRVPLRSLAWWVFPSPRRVFHIVRRTLSTALVAHCTIWNGSRHRHRLGCSGFDRCMDPLGTVGGDVGELLGAVGAEGVEKRQYRR